MIYFAALVWMCTVRVLGDTVAALQLRMENNSAMGITKGHLQHRTFRQQVVHGWVK